MHSITANIAVANAREALQFYMEAFNGEVIEYIETAQGCTHAQLKINTHTSLYLHDTPRSATGSQIRLAIALHDAAETESLFSALSMGGEVMLGLHQPSWTELYGELRDQFGVLWSLDCGPGRDVP